MRIESPELIPARANYTLAKPGHILVQDGALRGIWVDGHDGKPALRLFSDMC